jgi:hypothetical protein
MSTDTHHAPGTRVTANNFFDREGNPARGEVVAYHPDVDIYAIVWDDTDRVGHVAPELLTVEEPS